MQEVTVGIYMSHHKIYGVKSFDSSNFNFVSIKVWYENIIIFFLFIVMDSDKQGRMSVTIEVFSDSVLGNTANDTAGFSFVKYIIFGWLWSNFSYFVHGRGWIFLSMVVSKALKVPSNNFRGSFGTRPPAAKNIEPNNEVTYYKSYLSCYYH